ncbi:MAG: serine hydrolase domain-containing protein [Gammaproteobacteria bacterium]
MRAIRFSQALVLSLLLSLTQFVLAAELSSTRPSRVGMSDERLENLDAVMKSYVDSGQIAGQVIMLLRHGRVVYSTANGVRNIADNTPMTEDSMFRIASQTKAIVSTGIMILHERGELNIAAPLSNFIPEWADATVAVADGRGGYTTEPVSRAITLRDLLSHTSGIGYGMFGAPGLAIEEWEESGLQGWYLVDQTVPIHETAARMAAIPMNAHPGEQWIYGYNTDILGAVIEVVTGDSLGAFIQQEILDPLDMHDTHFFVPPEKAERMATVYWIEDDGSLSEGPTGAGMYTQGQYVQGQSPQVSYSGGAGLVSTARDYARFLQMMLDGGALGDTRILSPKTVELMTSNHLRDIPYQDGMGFGLGFSVVTDLGARGTLGSEGEFGWGGAYHSTYWVDPAEDLVVVYLTQFGPGVGLDDYSKLRAGIYAAIVE